MGVQRLESKEKDKEMAREGEVVWILSKNTVFLSLASEFFQLFQRAGEEMIGLGE